MAFATSYELRSAVAATFHSLDRAHEASHALVFAGFYDTWIGFVRRVDHEAGQLDPRGSDVVVEAENWFQRLFGEGQKTLHDVLVDSGITGAGSPARERLHAHSIILTVDSDHDFERAVTIIREFGGRELRSGFGDMLEPPEFAVHTPFGDLTAESAFPGPYAFIRTYDKAATLP
jgi:hypothetical protein